MSLSRAASATTRARRGLALIGRRDFRQRPVGIELRGVGSERDRQRGDGAFIVHEAVELETLFARLVVGLADDDEGAWQNLDRLGIAADLLRARLDVAIEGLVVGAGAQPAANMTSAISRRKAAVPRRTRPPAR